MATDRVQQILSDLSTAGQRGSTLPEQLCEACARALPVTGVGMALMSTRGPEGLVAATDGVARTMEKLQFSFGEGPCVDASVTGAPVLAPQFAAMALRRWPAFGPAAVDAGIEAVFAFPLRIGAIRLGVLDLYRDNPGSLTPAQLSEALCFADAATRILLHLQDQMPTGEGLHPDLILTGHDDGPVVHQATGMICVQAAVSIAEALLILRARAFATERPLLDLARDVVRGTLRFPPGSDHHK